MKLRSFLPILLGLFFIVACKNDENRNDTLEIQENKDSHSNTENENRSSPNSKSPSEVAGEEKSPGDPGFTEEDIDSATANSFQLSEGKYIKDGETDENCDCYCMDLTFSGTTELCLKEETIYITARQNRRDDGVVELFYVEPASGNSEGEDIPWDDFDKNVPIASISPLKNGKIELDWLGFTINGDLAMDYAIYGKKTLEGQYKKK